jgi:hypothetical protein
MSRSVRNCSLSKRWMDTGGLQARRSIADDQAPTVAIIPLPRPVPRSADPECVDLLGEVRRSHRESGLGPDQVPLLRNGVIED